MDTVIKLHNDDKIIKETIDQDGTKYASHLLIMSKNWEGKLPIIHSAEWKNNILKVVMDKGDKLNNSLSTAHITTLIDCLCSMEAYGMIHGDIKVENMIVINDKIMMIDFDYICTRNDSIVSQSYRDISGYAIQRRYSIKKYKAILAAMYALGISICRILNILDDKLYLYEQLVNIEKKIEDTIVNVEVSQLCHYIDSNYNDIVNKIEDSNLRDIVIKCICPIENRAQSFFKLVFNDNNNTRWIYDKCVKEGKTCKQTAILYEGYYRYKTIELEKLIELSNGECLMWIDDHNQTSRLLNEYNDPASWYIEVKKCYDIEELKEFIVSMGVNRLPETIMYCFGNFTRQISNARLI